MERHDRCRYDKVVVVDSDNEMTFCDAKPDKITSKSNILIVRFESDDSEPEPLRGFAAYYTTSKTCEGEFFEFCFL